MEKNQTWFSRDPLSMCEKRFSTHPFTRCHFPYTRATSNACVVGEAGETWVRLTMFVACKNVAKVIVWPLRGRGQRTKACFFSVPEVSVYPADLKGLNVNLLSVNLWYRWCEEVVLLCWSDPLKENNIPKISSVKPASELQAAVENGMQFDILMSLPRASCFFIPPIYSISPFPPASLMDWRKWKSSNWPRLPSKGESKAVLAPFWEHVS